MYRWGEMQTLSLNGSAEAWEKIESPDPNAVVLIGTAATSNTTLRMRYVDEGSEFFLHRIPNGNTGVGGQGMGFILSLGSDLFLKNNASAGVAIFYQIGVRSKF